MSVFSFYNSSLLPHSSSSPMSSSKKAMSRLRNLAPPRNQYLQVKGRRFVTVRPNLIFPSSSASPTPGRQTHHDYRHTTWIYSPCVTFVPGSAALKIISGKDFEPSDVDFVVSSSCADILHFFLLADTMSCQCLSLQVMVMRVMPLCQERLFDVARMETDQLMFQLYQ